MVRKALAIAILVALASGSDAAAATHRSRARASGSRASATRPARPPRRPHRGGRPTLAEAKAAMTALMRDRTRRRFRHHWERAIRGLLRAARGKQAAAAYLEAARARYALYRWSANEADREKALLNAARAAWRGSGEAKALARAIRREAGEERPSRPARRRRPPPPEPADDESPPDPALEAAVADLSPSAPPSGATAREPARVSQVRTWASEEYTRVAVYLSHWVEWHKIELPSSPDTPRRIALDFRPAVLEGAALARPVKGEQVDRVRAAQNDPETVRVVLELPGGDGVQVFALDDPPRLVVDVGTHDAEGERVATSKEPAAGTASPGATPSPPRSKPSVAGATSQDAAGAIRRIVIDAGHGGHDPGAIGPRGVREKDVTLRIVRRLAAKLRRAGFEVVLTRKNDRYLALEERTAIANTARGDLFVSIHANAHPRRNRSGVETYYLDVADNRYAARLAARENGADLGDGEAEVARILTDLDAKASARASFALARLVQHEVTRGVRARVGEVRDLGVKSALFYVLLGARMPAVLVETAFISNRKEERRLASARYQDEVAAGIARALSAFARRGQRVAVVQ